MNIDEDGNGLHAAATGSPARRIPRPKLVEAAVSGRLVHVVDISAGYVEKIEKYRQIFLTCHPICQILPKSLRSVHGHNEHFPVGRAQGLCR